MQKAEPDQENCNDVPIWTEDESTYNNREGHTELSFIANWLAGNADFASTAQNAENLPSASEADKTSWHELWNPLPVKRQSSDKQKREDRREKNRRSAKESRERAKQSKLREEENIKSLTKQNTKLHDDVEKLKDKVHNLQIVKASIIHQDSCKDKYNTVDINNSSGCIMPLQTLEKGKDYSLGENISSGKSTTIDDIVTSYVFYQQQGQHSVQQEVGTQLGLSIAPSGSYSCYSDASFQQFSGTSQATMPLNNDSIQKFSINLNTTNDRSSLISVGNVPTQLSQLPVNSVSELMTINTGKLHNTNVLSSQSNPTYIPLQSYSKLHSNAERPWCVETDQNDSKDQQELIDFFLE